MILDIIQASHYLQTCPKSIPVRRLETPLLLPSRLNQVSAMQSPNANREFQWAREPPQSACSLASAI